MDEIIGQYDRVAESLAATYEAQPFEEIHRQVLTLLPEKPVMILEVGAGSGRDAAWFADRGHEVVAVEPAAQLRDWARRHHPHPRIRWLDDRLPALDRVHRLGLSFDLIWLSAVWMHVPPGQRQRAFRKLVALLRPGGRIVLTLRQGLAPGDRPMHPVSVQELEHLARRQGMATLAVCQDQDRLGRHEVRWETLALQLPDDGTGALPLLRHVILNDDKSSTYKLALLRVLVRIADSAHGLVSLEGEDTASLPLGLVALYWLRMYKPLIEQGFRQTPASRRQAGLGFVREAFHRLRPVSPYDLRAGMQLTGDRGRDLGEALRDARNTIVRMPAFYITYPGQSEQIFKTTTRTVRLGDKITLDAPFLWSFGQLRMPWHLWQAMVRYAVWIEPALVTEWIELMRRYDDTEARPYEAYWSALRWLDPEHDTRGVRTLVQALQGQGCPVHCVWSGRRLGEKFAIDHCMPFAAWPCNDLWNLLPSHPCVNLRKGDRLPSAAALARAQEAIMQWWAGAYQTRPALRQRFADEARAALPNIEDDRIDSESVFDGVMVQRTLLSRAQQLPEWEWRSS